MNCLDNTKQIKRNEAFKKLLATWAFMGVVGGLIGFGIGAYVYKPDADQTNVIIYGNHESKIVKASTKINFERKNNFVRLDVPLDLSLQQFIFTMCDAYKVDYALVMAVIQKESNFETLKISTSNDYGLMQINRINHDSLKQTIGVENFLNPYENVKAGIYMLRCLFEKYKAPNKVLMAYNLGETGASRLWEKGITETPYTNAVFEYQSKFADIMVQKFKGGEN